MHAPIALAESLLRAGKVHFCRRGCCPPKLAGLRHLARIEAEGQRYGSPKNGHSEANRLAIALCAAKLPHAQTALR